MTEIILAKVWSGAAGTMTGMAVVIAVIDPAIKDIILAVVAAAVVLTPVIFAYKTAALNKKNAALESKVDIKTAALEGKIKEVEKTSNGMKDALVLATSKASRAEGEIAGRKDQKLEEQAKTIATQTPPNALGP